MNVMASFLLFGTFTSALFAAMFASAGRLRCGLACLAFVLIFLIGLVVEQMGTKTFGLVPLVAMLMLCIWGAASGFGMKED